jgi:hypothetical protein
MRWFPLYQWIGLRENLQENPIFNGKIYIFPVDVPLNQSIDYTNPEVISSMAGKVEPFRCHPRLMASSTGVGSDCVKRTGLCSSWGNSSRGDPKPFMAKSAV